MSDSEDLSSSSEFVPSQSDFDDSKDTRPVCKYGEKCYQKNEEHHLKYRHPHLEREKSSLLDGLDEKMEDVEADKPSSKRTKKETSSKKTEEVIIDDEDEDKPKTKPSDTKSKSKTKTGKPKSTKPKVPTVPVDPPAVESLTTTTTTARRNALALPLAASSPEFGCDPDWLCRESSKVIEDWVSSHDEEELKRLQFELEITFIHLDAHDRSCREAWDRLFVTPRVAPPLKKLCRRPNCHVVSYPFDLTRLTPATLYRSLPRWVAVTTDDALIADGSALADCIQLLARKAPGTSSPAHPTFAGFSQRLYDAMSDAGIKQESQEAGTVLTSAVVAGDLRLLHGVVPALRGKTSATLKRNAKVTKAGMKTALHDFYHGMLDAYLNDLRDFSK
eukprot:gnl/Dysnectes_brevis/778_a856_2677.p1 GENE.gnl/Dysnectes_brevis/778_a856_2677~~gnl/Dysnectes_brevis/778_a856_2677.p1  ORF type:complete len:389 (+),score=74.39 gnl/Dysnectes_brevis/778_a856_2677:82-1248(+)